MEDTTPPSTPNEITTVPPIPDGKIYSNNVIYRATFFGGPLVAGYMMAANFKIFGETRKANWAWFWSILFCIVLCGTIVLLSDYLRGKSPNAIIPVFYSTAAYYIAKHYQGEKITTHLNAGGQKYGGWRAFLISIIGLFVLVIFFFGLIYTKTIFSNNNIKATNALGYNSIKTYGAIKNEIAYNAGNISDEQLDTIAALFTKAGYFKEFKNQKEILVKKTDKTYEISVILNSIIKTDTTKYVSPFKQFRKEAEYLFPGHKLILIILISDDLNHVYKRIE